jgi:hypothetical protein
MTYVLPEDENRSLEISSQPGQRVQGDRRRVPTGPMDAFRLSGRRQRVRRGAEREGPFFADRFDAFTLALIVSLLALTIVDGVLTIELLELNSEEFNPVMDHLLTWGHTAFFLGKYVLTAAGIPLLVVYKNHRMFGTWFRVGYLLPVFVAMYVTLVSYQVALLGEGDLRREAHSVAAALEPGQPSGKPAPNPNPEIIRDIHSPCRDCGPGIADRLLRRQFPQRLRISVTPGYEPDPTAISMSPVPDVDPRP